VRLAKEGFAPLDSILAMPTTLVLAALDYSNCLNDYQAAYVELNKDT